MSQAPSEPPTGGEDAIIAARRAKAERLRQRGENPFANHISEAGRTFVAQARAHFEPALLEPKSELRYDSERAERLGQGRVWQIAGRVIGRRDFGKLSFLVLRDGTGELQLFAKQDLLKDQFARLEEIDVADHIEARGRMMVTKKGELSLEAVELRLLTKALRPLPDKWHGLSDVDLRYRRRYLDLVANPEVAAVLRLRSLAIQGLRGYLDREGFLEVETPTLHSLVGGAAARPFVTHHNALDLDLFLRIAPELYLKRLLVGGFERVYEIGRCYRNEGISTRHSPEFTMLESYQAYATYETLMPMAERLIRHVDGFVRAGLERDGLNVYLERWLAERQFTFDEPFARVPLRRALERALRIAELPLDLIDQLETLGRVSADKRASDAKASAGSELIDSLRERSRRNIDWKNLTAALGGCASAGERLFVAYEYIAEPFLPDDYRSSDGKYSLPVFITDYPAETSPLARRKDSDPTLVDRFELFVQHLELCNAFSELNDPDDQAARFRDQMDKKQGGAAEAMDYDADYVLALEHGMPPAAGFGMGIDRLVMTLAAQPSIRDVIAFPLLRPETGT